MGETKRSDPADPRCSDWIIHLTRARIGKYRHWEKKLRPDSLWWKLSGRPPEPPSNEKFEPLAVLTEILQEGIVHGSGYDGKIKAGHTAVCFTRGPLSEVRHLAADPTRYSYYGIAMTEDAALAAGAQPVQYLSEAESAKSHREERWRHVRFEIGASDWTHEREWRVRGDLNLRSVAGFHVLVWTASEEIQVSSVIETYSNFLGFHRMEQFSGM